MITLNCKSLNDLPEIASKIIDLNIRKIAFYGNLGAGKTTLIKEICKQLGIPDIVNSPTFTILNEYEGKFKVDHFDFYRIKNKNELYEIGYEEYFYSDDYVFIEWPEKIGDLLPDFFSSVRITTRADESRLIEIKIEQIH